MEILSVSNLKKVYTTRFGGNQVQALKNINFSVDKGEYVAVMGESGSGKTTLLNILAALDKPTAGNVLLNGVNNLPLSKTLTLNATSPSENTLTSCTTALYSSPSFIALKDKAKLPRSRTTMTVFGALEVPATPILNETSTCLSGENANCMIKES